MSTMRIACSSGFWGDRDDVLLEQVRGGPVDVVMADYLAEVTMAILRRQRAQDPSAGWARDFAKALDPALEEIADRGIAVVTNAGGMNPHACAEAVLEAARRRGIRDLPVGVVSGDDMMEDLDRLADGPAALAHLDDGRPFGAIRDRVLSANVYMGSEPIAQALGEGARIVVTGRCTDSALVLGPLLWRFGWGGDEWNRRAAGIVAGHVIECGGHASGGNFAGGWEQVPDLARLGYPIAEVGEDGDIVVTKHESLGGMVTPAVVKEQLLYEIGDPRAYLTPDVTVDFTSIRLEDLGDDRVRLSGIEGRPPPEQLKASITFENGWTAVASLGFVWPDAEKRARAAAEILVARCEHRGIELVDHRVDVVGVSAAQGPMAPAPEAPPNEVLLRVAVRTRDRDAAKRFGREVAPLITSGIPGACRGMSPGRPEPRPIVDHWPALVPRDAVTPRVEVLEP